MADIKTVVGLVWNVVKVDCQIISIGIAICFAFIGGIIAFGYLLIAICWLVAWPYYTLRGKKPPAPQYLIDLSNGSGES